MFVRFVNSNTCLHVVYLIHQVMEGKKMTLKDKSNIARNYTIINKDFYNDMIQNATTPEQAMVWLALGEAAGHIKKI